MNALFQTCFTALAIFTLAFEALAPFSGQTAIMTAQPVQTCPTFSAIQLSAPPDGTLDYYDIGGPYELEWQGISGIGGYELEIINLATNQAAYHAVIQTSGYEFRGDGQYQWHVRAVSPIQGCSPGPWSALWHYEVHPYPAPPPPINVRASDGTYTDRVRLTWETSPTTNGFEAFWVIQRASHSDGVQTTLNDEVSSLAYDDLTARVGEIYDYWVLACNHDGKCSQPSVHDHGWASNPPCPALQPPAMDSPANNAIVTYPVGQERVYVTWHSVDGAKAFHIYIKSATTETEIMDVSTTATSAWFKPTLRRIRWWVAEESEISGCPQGPLAGPWEFELRPIGTPPVPVGVTASDATYTDRVVLKWQPGTANGVPTDHFEIYRAESQDGAKTLIESVANYYVQYDDMVPGIQPFKVYYYWLKACTAWDSCSDFSQANTGLAGTCPMVAAPVPTGPPHGTTITYDPDGMVGESITWKLVANASGYQVEILDPKGAVNQTNTTDTFLQIMASTGPGTYKWHVRAYNIPGCKSSPWSSAWSYTLKIIPPPAVPINVQASDGIYPDRVKLTWEEGPFNGSHPDTYRVYRSETQSGTKTQLNSNEWHLKSWEDTTAVPNKTYDYWVSACNLIGNCSSFSQPNTGKAGACPAVTAPVLVNPPNGKTIYYDPNGAVEDGLVWNSVAGTTGYQLEIKDPKGVVRQFNTTDTFHEIINYVDQGTYQWRVLATNLPGCKSSPWSAAWSYTLKYFPAPAVPVNVQASDGTYPDRVRITWQDGPFNGWQPESYIVYRSDSLSGAKTRLTPNEWLNKDWEDATAAPGRMYYYWISACNHIFVCSAVSQPDSGRAGAPPVLLPSLWLPVITR